jgi:hypothetical protein
MPRGRFLVTSDDHGEPGADRSRLHSSGSIGGQLLGVTSQCHGWCKLDWRSACEYTMIDELFRAWITCQRARDPNHTTGGHQ